MVSLKDLRSAAVALDWHEAVAAGAALGTLLAAADAPACPGAADVALLSSGDLRVTGPGLVDGPAAAGVATVLAELLESSPCPAELRQLLERYANERRGEPDGAPAAGDLVAELAFFERPGRRDVLAALARRAEPALEQARRAEALDALTERTRLAAGAIPAPTPVALLPGVPQPPAPEPAPAQSGWGPQDESGLGRFVVPAAVGLAAFMAVAYVAAAWLDRPPAPPALTEVVDDGAPESGATSPRATAPPAGATPGTGPASAPARPRPTGPAAPGVGTSAAAPAASAPPASPSPDSTSRPSPRPVDVVVAEREGRVVPSRNAPVRPAPPLASPPGRVFERGDPHVTPPVLIRPHLPENPPPDVPEEQIGTLEFVVAESGAVEHVRLISPANRYQERMLVAAAKTWQFKPATLNGRPVRYRTRIRLTL